MSSLVNVSDIVDNNLLSRTELLEYIQTSLRVNVRRLTDIITHTSRETLPQDNLTLIPYHRYGLFLENDAVLHIVPTEGPLRIEHLELQTRCLSKVLDKSIRFSSTGELNPTHEAAHIINNVEDALHEGEVISGIIIGSLRRFALLANMHIRPEAFYTKLARLRDGETEAYFHYRATQETIERLALKGKLVLSPEEQTILLEGAIPTDRQLDILRDITARLDPQYIGERVAQFLHDKNLQNTLLVDYLFFRDLQTGTRHLYDVLNSAETIIEDNNGCTFQLLRIEGKTYVNFGWINAALLGEIIRQLQLCHPIQTFHMYGKCGSLFPALLPGQIVAPAFCYTTDSCLNVTNTVVSLPQVGFCCVHSPLIETHKWMSDMRKYDIRCVEMELYPALAHLSMKVRRSIIYYVSDMPMGSVKIAHRFSFLPQKMQCVQLLFNDLLATSPQPTNSPSPAFAY